MSVHEAGLVALDHLCDDTAEVGVAAIGDRLKVLRDVMKGLLAGGTVSVADIWTWIPVILQLIQTLGPLVQEIIDKIKAAIGKGQTAATFA